jgi:hypothetical protein
MLFVTQRTGQGPCFAVFQTSSFLTLNLFLMRIRWLHGSGSHGGIDWSPLGRVVYDPERSECTEEGQDD